MSISNRRMGAKWGWRRWLMATGTTAAVAAALVYWQISPLKPASAQAAPPAPTNSAPSQDAPAYASDYSKRVVAYVHDSVPVTREQLGEYLIARYGNEKLELMVNKMIIDEACKARNIEVTTAEIDAQLGQDLKGLQLDHKQFVANYLKAHHMNLYMWKEDVIRPKLQLMKMARDRVTYTEAEVQQAWEAYHGEKIEARIILWPKDEERQAQAEYGRLRDNPEAFEMKSKSQASPQLSSKGVLSRRSATRQAVAAKASKRICLACSRARSRSCTKSPKASSSPSVSSVFRRRRTSASKRSGPGSSKRSWRRRRCWKSPSSSRS